MKASIVGTWRLVDYIHQQPEIDEARRPWGDAAAGLLVYGTDGYMSVQMMAERPSVSPPGERRLAAADSPFVAYAGRYELEGDQGLMRITIECSSFAEWAGTVVTRFFDWEGERLWIRSPPLLDPSTGRTFVARAAWQRAPLAREEPADEILYTVILHAPDTASRDRAMAWILGDHAKDVCDAGALSAVVALRDDACALQVQYRFESREALDAYERDHAPKLRAEALARFPTEHGFRYERSRGAIKGTIPRL